MKITLPRGGDPEHLKNVAVMARELMDQHGLEDWTFKWDRAHKRSGRCNYTDTTISLSAPLMSLWDEYQCRDTILHEIAHALDLPENPSHGPKWQALCRGIGAIPVAHWGCLGEPHIKPKYKAVCRSGHEHFRSRRSKTQMSCATCSPKFDPQNVLDWRENK